MVQRILQTDSATAGRTPLHLAVTSSTPEIVKTLINHGARLVARLADGRTALHLAAARGNVEMVRMIMQKSEENEEEEAKKEDIRKKTRMAARENKSESDDTKPTKSNEAEDEDLDIIEEDEADSDVEAHSTTTGSYLKVKESDAKTSDAVPEENDDEPDVYDVNVLAWDLQCSPLHLAILNGHIDVVKELVQSFGADVLLPIKLFNDHDKSPKGAILTLVLSLNLPLEAAKEMTKTLLSLGASSTQADTRHATAFHQISNSEPSLLDVLLENDEPAVKRAINHAAVTGSSWNPSAQTPFMSAIMKGDGYAALKLLGLGATATVEFKDWMKSVEAQHSNIARNTSEFNRSNFNRNVEQPIILSVDNELPDIAHRLLDMGVDPNTLTRSTRQNLQSNFSHYDMYSLLDSVRNKITELRSHAYSHRNAGAPTKPHINLKEGLDYMEGIEPGTYKHFVAQVQLESAAKADKRAKEGYEEQVKNYNERTENLGWKEKGHAIEAMAESFERLEQTLLEKGAKTFKELYPDIKTDKRHEYNSNYKPYEPPPFKIWFNFSVHDLTDETRAAYLKL